MAQSAEKGKTILGLEPFWENLAQTHQHHGKSGEVS